MKLLQTIIAELARPDDQGRDWYGWATNQLSHVSIGFGVTGLLLCLCAPVWVAAIVAGCLVLAKEARDFSTSITLRTAIDKLTDTLFMGLGIVLGISGWLNEPQPYIAAFVAALLLLASGIVPRAITAIKIKPAKE